MKNASLVARSAWLPFRVVLLPMHVCLALVALAVPLALAGCGGSSTVTPQPTSLEISRTVPADLQGPPTYFLPFDKTFSDTAVVQRFYTQTRALPRFAATPGPNEGCGPTLVPYQLTFRHDTTTVLAGTLMIGNCGTLSITTEDGRHASDAREYDTAYEADLAQVLGITPQDLYPIYHSSPPSTVTPTVGQ